jgi:hypothetical protein
MIVDVSFVGIWDYVEKSESSAELLERLDEAWKEFPLGENVYTVNFNGKKMPMIIYALFLLLKGRESEKAELKKYYYNKFIRAFNDRKFKNFRKYYSKEYEEAGEWYEKGFKPSYEIMYGEEKAADLKKRISSSMKKIDKEIINKRNESIKKAFKEKSI